MTTDHLPTTDPRTGEISDSGIAPSRAEDVAAIAAKAERAHVELTAMTRADRAVVLEAMADALDRDSDRLVKVAGRETGLTPPPGLRARSRAPPFSSGCSPRPFEKARTWRPRSTPP